MKEYQNYLFDLYGTLVDVHTNEKDPLLWQRLCILLRVRGVTCTAETLQGLYAHQVSALETQARQERGQWAEIDILPVFAAMFPQKSLPERAVLEDLAWQFRLLSLEKLRLYPGAKELLLRLKDAGKQIYLLSNAQALFTMPELKALGLDELFDGIVISSREGLKKPDTELYQRTLARYDLHPQQTVMVGNDHRADCWGAHAAGLDSMYVFTEQSPEREDPLPVNCRLLTTIGDVF